MPAAGSGRRWYAVLRGEVTGREGHRKGGWHGGDRRRLPCRRCSGWREALSGDGAGCAIGREAQALRRNSGKKGLRGDRTRVFGRSGTQLPNSNRCRASTLDIASNRIWPWDGSLDIRPEYQVPMPRILIFGSNQCQCLIPSLNIYIQTRC